MTTSAAEEDFDYEGAEWIDCTPTGLVAGVYEEQLDVRSTTGQMRHRSYFQPTQPWKRGSAPRE